MGVYFVAVNHDRKEGFAVGKCLGFSGCDPVTFAYFKVTPTTEQEMIDYIWSELDPARNYTKDFVYEDAVDLGTRLWKFGVQEVLSTDEAYDDEKYDDYVMVDSYYDNDSDVGRTLNHHKSE